MEQNQELDY